MNITRLIAGLFTGTCMVASAGVYYGNNAITVPDGSPVGVVDKVTVGDVVGTVNKVEVNLNLTSAYVGDLYVYLSHGGELVPLLNRVGATGATGGSSFGYGSPDSAMNVVFSDSGDHNIHLYKDFSDHSVLNGTKWQADGHMVNPGTSNPSDFDNATIKMLSAFNGLDATGTWTLFLADMSGGDVATVGSWSMSLDITPVPEPVNVALGFFGGLVAVVGLAQNERVRGMFRKSAVS